MLCVRVCVCARLRVCACVRVCVCACVRVCVHKIIKISCHFIICIKTFVKQIVVVVMFVIAMTVSAADVCTRSTSKQQDVWTAN